MLKCLCINDSHRPSKIPATHWIKKGEEYTILFARFVRPQNILGFQLNEIMLDEYCAPYEYFIADRFAIHKDDIQKLQDFIRECEGFDVSLDEIKDRSGKLVDGTFIKN